MNAINAGRRTIGRFMAARYVGVQTLEFDQLVRNGAIPNHVGGLWFVDEIDKAFPKGEASGRVYVAGFDSYVKIGFSADVDFRLAEISRGLPQTLSLYCSYTGTMKDERDLHIKFSDYRTRGEWFRKNGLLADWIASGCPLDLRQNGVSINQMKDD